MDIHRGILDVETAAGPMAILHKRPAGEGRWPKVVKFHDGPGVRTATHEFAEELAAVGYEVVVPDLYHRHGRLVGFDPAQREADPSITSRLREMMQSLTDDGIQADLDATLDACGFGRSEPFAVIGFCLGARAVFRTMQRFPDQVVAGAMWHPSFLADDTPDSPHLSAAALSQPLFIGIGDADRMQPIEVHQPFFDAVAPLDHVEVQVFPGADHGYTWPGWPTYDEHAASQSFAKTTALFAEHLLPPTD